MLARRRGRSLYVADRPSLCLYCATLLLTQSTRPINSTRILSTGIARSARRCTTGLPRAVPGVDPPTRLRRAEERLPAASTRQATGRTLEATAMSGAVGRCLRHHVELCARVQQIDQAPRRSLAGAPFSWSARSFSSSTALAAFYRINIYKPQPQRLDMEGV